jgi:hypothetical protein
MNPAKAVETPVRRIANEGAQSLGADKHPSRQRFREQIDDRAIVDFGTKGARPEQDSDEREQDRHGYRVEDAAREPIHIRLTGQPERHG